MKCHLTIALVVLITPLASVAAEPERLLSPGTQVYFRWDGVQAHQAAYRQTALGKTLQGDTGTFFASLVGELKEQLGATLTVPQLLAGATPERLQQLQTDAEAAPKLLDIITAHGFVAGFEVRFAPLRGVGAGGAGGLADMFPLEFTLIFPQAGKEPVPFEAAFRLLALVAEQPLKEDIINQRKVLSFSEGEGQDTIYFVGWTDDADAIFVIGASKPENVVKRAAAKQSLLTDNALFRRVNTFKEFPTASRGFVNLEALVKFGSVAAPEAARIINELGLNGLKDLTFHTGFAGDAGKTLIQLDVTGERKGLLKLAAGKPFQLGDLPPLPDDTTNFSALRIDPAALFDVGVEIVEIIMKLDAPDQEPGVKQALEQADKLLGVNIRQDLIGSLGDMLATYNSPAEGPLGLGQVMLIKVKDAEKLEASLNKMLKALTPLAGGGMSVKKKAYRGVATYELHVGQEAFFFVPTYTIHKGWFAISLFPQPIHGLILRGNGELPVWEPGPRVRQSLAQLPKDYVALSVSDPRPSIKQLLNFLPIIFGLFNSLEPDSKVVEVGSLPNAHEATRYLFPNVTVATASGDTLRIETLSSLYVPVELSGLDIYMFVFFVFARFL
ncbi:MAG: hypothetical protein ACK4RK_06100 [Gemmataceae bacterium]